MEFKRHADYVEPEPEDEPMKCNPCEVIASRAAGHWARECQFQGRLAVGQTVYSDRAYKFTSIPDELLGGHWIQTYNADKGSSADDYIRFTLGCDATVYVCFDRRPMVRPDWLTQFEQSLLFVRESSILDRLEVFEKVFRAGEEVVLGGCRATPLQDRSLKLLTNMVVVVQPTSEPVPPEEEPSDIETDMAAIPLTGTYTVERGIADDKIHLVLN